jgi:hypothetical protein
MKAAWLLIADVTDNDHHARRERDFSLLNGCYAVPAIHIILLIHVGISPHKEGMPSQCAGCTKQGRAAAAFSWWYKTLSAQQAGGGFVVWQRLSHPGQRLRRSN